MEFKRRDRAARLFTKVLWSHRLRAYILRPAHAGPRMQKAVGDGLCVAALRSAIVIYPAVLNFGGCVWRWQCWRFWVVSHS